MIFCTILTEHKYKMLHKILRMYAIFDTCFLTAIHIWYMFPCSYTLYLPLEDSTDEHGSPLGQELIVENGGIYTVIIRTNNMVPHKVWMR